MQQPLTQRATCGRFLTVAFCLALFFLLPLNGSVAQDSGEPALEQLDLPRDLFKVVLQGQDQATALKSMDVEPVARLGNSYLILAGTAAAEDLQLRGIEAELLTTGVQKGQLALDWRADRDLTVDYELLFQQDDFRLLRVDPAQLEAAADPPDLLPIHNEQLRIIYREPVSMPVMDGIRALEAVTDLNALVSNVEQDSVESYMYQLQAFNGRLTGTPENYASRDWIVSKFEDFGFDSVYIDPFEGKQLWGRVPVPAYNVVAVKVGSLYPDRHIVIGAHFDAVPESPGADDNGSGTTGVLEIARVLIDEPTDVTLIFVAFDSEESGLIGSWHYADGAVARGDDLLMMFNMDMIAELSNSGEAWIRTGANPLFGEIWTDMASSLAGLTAHVGGSSSSSDHYPFDQNGFDFAYIVEYYSSTVYHQPDDSTSHVNFDYLTRMIKASVATVYSVSNTEDLDGDGIPNATDNCIVVVNPAQLNADGDSYGDACDNCPDYPSDILTDTDGDGVGDVCDNCPYYPSDILTDTDDDGVGDVCDNCLTTPNPDQRDDDNDGEGDACEQVRIVSLTEDGPPCLESEIALVGDGLAGEVSVNILAPGVPAGLTFEILNTSGFDGDQVQFYLNGWSLGTVDADPANSWSCDPGIQTYSVTDADLLSSAWKVNGNNEFHLESTQNYAALIAWIRVRIDRVIATETYCLYDFGGGSCQETNLCAADYWWYGFDEYIVIPAPVLMPTPIVATSYSNSSLSGQLDISSIPDGPYYLCASAVVTGVASIESLTFTVLAASCSPVPDVLEFFLNDVSLGLFDGPDLYCYCDAPEITFGVTDPALLAAWQPGTNEIRFTRTGADATALAWVNVEVGYSGTSQTVCIFDHDDGNCDIDYLCSAGYTWVDLDETKAVAVGGGDPRIDCELFVKQCSETVLGVNDATCNGIPGSVTGLVLADCPAPNTGLIGVSVDAYRSCTGDLIGTAATDADGHFEIPDLYWGEYTVTLVAPLGYRATIDEQSVTVPEGEAVPADFPSTCIEITANPRSIGFWKHQVGVALGGKGKAQIDGPTLCDYLDLIESHFNSNTLNQVIVYEPPQSGMCEDKLEAAKMLLNLKGNVGITARAKQQLMAMLFNVAAQKISLTEIVSVDSATLSQAITYCDNLIDDPLGDHHLAKTIGDEINNNRTLPAGVIPLGTDNIAYKSAPTTFALAQNYPNPFNPSTGISFSLAQAADVRLEVYNAIGQRVAVLVDSWLEAGPHTVVWNGCHAASGVYLYRLEAGQFVDTRKMLLLK